MSQYKFFSTGVTRDMPPAMKRRVRILNILVTICVAHILVAILIDLISRSTQYSSIRIMHSCIIVLVALLIRKRHYHTATYVFLVSLLGSIIYASVSIPHQNMFILTIFVAIAISFYLVENLVWNLFYIAACYLAFLYLRYYQIEHQFPVFNKLYIFGLFIVFSTYALTYYVILKENNFYQRLVNKQNLQLKEKNRKLNEQNEQLKELNTLKDKFFRLIAHDLKNPFHGLIGLSDILLNHYELLSEEERKDIVRKIELSSQNGYELLENLLQWTISQTDGLTAKPETCSAYLLTEENIRLLKETASAKYIRIINQVDPQLMIYADKNMLSTVLRNLLSNAIKFTKEEGSIIFSSARLENQAEISVQDNGIGMNVETVQRILENKTLLPSEGTANEKGTGLGLILCREFIAKNQGSITVDSEQGTGTRFSVRLPASA